MSAALTVGSPVLAGYSLFITLPNSCWITRRFTESVDDPNSLFAISILANLQQVPIRLHFDRDFLSLIVHLDNDAWWKYLSELVDYSHTLSIASTASITWVVIAYFLTVANSPLDEFGVNSDGGATGSMWPWLIPILVVGWLQLSPKCDFGCLQAAYERANQHTRRAAADSHSMGTPPASTRRALTITARDEDVSCPDELLTPPVFNYSRSPQWASTAETAFQVFKVASEKADNHIPGRFGNVLLV
ncbi:hypothetical protein AZE42_04590 [Rhizopogon vesiculosus]|uniref:Uncharacterized protein n=1 Tax=Rhizopogon vesiculosus TaxID=180088 RepID=A0A1J8PUI0_9AGAM|nr:hypothetical protein AZE42_04590 [Rhizopogon vesiculosus]